MKPKFNSEMTLLMNNCRVCYLEKGEIPIFDNFVQSNIAEEIKNFSGVMIIETDKLSKHICQSCLDLLNGCIMFRDMCQKTNKSMQEKLKHNEECTHVKIEQIENKKELKQEENVVDKICKEIINSNDTCNSPSPAPSLYSGEEDDIFDCPACDKKIYTMSSYKIHSSKCKMKIKITAKVKQKESKSMDKKQFLCDICGKIAFSNASLLGHMVIHENIFPFKCDVCPYRGRTKDLLNVHKRSHMTEKPFKCTQCPKACTTASNLSKHIRHIHTSNRPYKCTYCDRTFSFQHYVKRHIRDIHLRQGVVECEVCLKKFNTKKILQGHRWKVHKIKGIRHGRLPSYLQCQTDKKNNADDPY